MGSKYISDSLLTLDQNESTKDKPFESNFDNFSKLELVEKLKETTYHCNKIEESNKELLKSVSKLEKSLEDQCKKIKTLEEDKSVLRNNIKKATDNWFERKAKLSESDHDNQERIDVDFDDEYEVETKDKKDVIQFFIADETVKLFSELKFKDEQLELSERRVNELKKRANDYEKVIDDQEIIIHGLEKQLDTYFHDNQKMSKQLADLHKLFIDLEAINEKQVNVAVIPQDAETSTEHLPTTEDFKEMSGSVTKTYMKLKELIYEKKSLVTEIERLRTLNVELQNRVSQQETRLISVSDALQTTWLLVSNLKEEHEKLHTAETILRYELKEKREILHRLRNELECSREQWHIIRQKNSETEQEWTILREELNERRRLRKLAEISGSPELTPEEIEGATGISKSSENEFEPPVDLLVDMGIEYGVVEADDEESSTVVALIDGEDVHEDRLHNLEEQCNFLYQKLMSSTARALTLASRLSSLHQHYAMSDDDDDDEDNENEQYFDDEEEANIYESELVSPDSDSYDTAYVSEADGADSGSVSAENNAGVSNGVDNPITSLSNEDSPEFVDEGCDLLSRRLITFLPRKIEILKAENKKLEERLQTQQEEKSKLEERLTASLECERRQRKQVEQQLSHLGKCVDELKLERNGKIAKVEEELRKKVEEVEKEEKECIELKDKYEELKEKFEERGNLLQLTATQLETTVEQSEIKLSELNREILELKQEIDKERRVNMELTKIVEEESQNKSTSKSSKGCDPENKTNVHNTEEEERAVTTLENASQIESQSKKLVLLTNTYLRIPFHLTTDSVLCWSFHVTPQEIRFSITYDDNHLREIDKSDEKVNDNESESNTEESKEGLKHCNEIQLLRELLPPHCVESSSSEVVGRLIPKIPGCYCLVFQNKESGSQEVFLKYWTERINEG